MADIKTNLRELSVLVGIKNLVSNTKLSNDPKVFFNQTKEIIPIQNYENIANMNVAFFNIEEKSILENGYKLALKIKEKFNINKIENLKWYGFDTQKESPVDISINNLDFSLKEESFILENMGLYKLVNLFTNSNYDRLHIFEDYALTEYKEWFDVTWNIMIEYLKNNSNEWYLIDASKNRKATIKLQNNNIHFVYERDGITNTSILPIKTTLDQFKDKTNGVTREQVFSKWINKEISDNPKYLKFKKHCSVVASDKLAKYLLDNLDYKEGLPRFLRIHEKEYYYAKTTNLEQIIYYVPSISDYQNKLEIESIIGSVPTSQANVITTIRNKETNQKLILRNECRFSHGQFNGTPEAKMYYQNGKGTLLAIYKEI